MNIQITSRKFRAKDSLKDFIKAEVESLSKFNDDILEANVILSFHNINNSMKIAEINLKVPGKSLNASEESDDFTKSVTVCVHKLERQLRKVKTKRLAKSK